MHICKLVTIEPIKSTLPTYYQVCHIGGFIPSVWSLHQQDATLYGGKNIPSSNFCKNSSFDRKQPFLTVVLFHFFRIIKWSYCWYCHRQCHCLHSDFPNHLYDYDKIQKYPTTSRHHSGYAQWV